MNRYGWRLGLAAVLAGLGLFMRRDQMEFPAGKWGKKPLHSYHQKILRQFVPRVTATLIAGQMPVQVGIAQAALETGWGKAGRKNPWGQRGVGDAGSDLITTHEVFNVAAGQITLKNQKFAHYSSDEAAAAGYVRFLDGARYREGWHLRHDPGMWLLWIWGVGYATATHYATSAVDVSRRVAVELDDPSLAIEPWTDDHRAIADALSKANAGSQRRALTRKLLGARS